MSCKKLIRREMIEKRKMLDVKNGGVFTQMIKGLDCYRRAKAVMLYMPVKGEADVTGLIGDDKVFLLPVTDGDDMYACLCGKTKAGPFGVPVPEEEIVFDKDKIDVVIVPGVAFDKEGNRMGYGRGYYDRFLQDISAVRVGVCHSFQVIESVPCEEHDVKMDIIVTESGIWSNVNTL